jgi:hypothetical protein
VRDFYKTNITPLVAATHRPLLYKDFDASSFYQTFIVVSCLDANGCIRPIFTIDGVQRSRLVVVWQQSCCVVVVAIAV